MVLHIVNSLGFQEDRQERLCNLVSSGPMLFRTKSKAPPTVTPESHSSTFYSSSFANAYGNDFDDNDADGNDFDDNYSNDCDVDDINSNGNNYNDYDADDNNSNDHDADADVNNSNDDDTDGNDVRDFKNY